MKKKTGFICCAIIGATILFFALLRVMGVRPLSMADILGLPLPLLIAELEICSGIAYFLSNTQKRKIKTVLTGSRLLLALGAAVLCVIWTIRWILKQYSWGEIPAQVACVLGILMLLSSIADIIYYRYRETEKSFGKVIALIGKSVCSALVIQLSFFGWLLNGLAAY